MFVCIDCEPEVVSLTKSYGPCELCGNIALCKDIHLLMIDQFGIPINAIA